MLFNLTNPPGKTIPHRRQDKKRDKSWSQKPYLLKNKDKNNGTYIRVGSSNRKASFEIIEELERQKRKIAFDSVTVYKKFDADKSLRSFIDFFKNQSGKL